jgi:HEAT repeat protein
MRATVTVALVGFLVCGCAQVDDEVVRTPGAATRLAPPPRPAISVAPAPQASPRAGAPVEPAPCGALEACLAAIRTTAAPGAGIKPNETALAEAIRHHGRAAVPGLLALLQHGDPDVRALAAYTIRDMDDLTEAETAPLVAALAAGEGWVALALARIGTPAAIAGLFEDLRRRPQKHTQVTGAFRKLGPKGVPALLGGFECAPTCDKHLLSVITFIFRELKQDGATAADGLMRIATDRGRPLEVRRAAVASLGGIGPAAASTAPTVQRLAGEDPALAEPVQRALQGLKVPAGAEGLAVRLAKSPDVVLLRDLAEMGPGGQPAGPAVVPLLDHDDWRLRWAAARTLGYIGYQPGVPRLIAALRDDQDWQLVYAAAESLGRIGLAEAVPALDTVARQHWYPPVRQVAGNAAAAIARGERPEPKPSPGPFGFKFFDVERAGTKIPSCRPNSSPRQFLPRDDLDRALAAVGEYVAAVDSYTDGPDGKPVKHTKSIRQRPSSALQVDGGWLLGADRGEWGGELVFRSAQGAQTILSDNIQHLRRLGSRVIALGGLAHLTGNRGLIYELVRDQGGRWSARPWRVLPGAPRGSAEVNGRWVIHSVGGSVALAPDGTMSMAECP